MGEDRLNVSESLFDGDGDNYVCMIYIEIGNDDGKN